MNKQLSWIERNPEKHKAHYTVANAIKSGKLVKQPCEICGNTKVQAHHDDYSKPLEIRWLCTKHHSKHHYPNAISKTRKIPRLESHKKFQPLIPNPLISKAIELRSNGLSYGEISNELGYSRSQIYKWVNDKHN